MSAQRFSGACKESYREGSSHARAGCAWRSIKKVANTKKEEADTKKSGKAAMRMAARDSRGHGGQLRRRGRRGGGQPPIRWGHWEGKGAGKKSRAGGVKGGGRGGGEGASPAIPSVERSENFPGKTTRRITNADRYRLPLPYRRSRGPPLGSAGLLVVVCGWAAVAHLAWVCGRLICPVVRVLAYSGIV